MVTVLDSTPDRQHVSMPLSALSSSSSLLRCSLTEPPATWICGSSDQGSISSARIPTLQWGLDVQESVSRQKHTASWSPFYALIKRIPDLGQYADDGEHEKWAVRVRWNRNVPLIFKQLFMNMLLWIPTAQRYLFFHTGRFYFRVMLTSLTWKMSDTSPGNVCSLSTYCTCQFNSFCENEVHWF